MRANTVGERVKKIRQELGLKQVEFSQSILISQGFLAEIETGKKNPSPRVVFTLCQKYGINPKWLVDGKGNKRTNDVSPTEDEKKMLVKLRERGLSPAIVLDAIDRLQPA